MINGLNIYYSKNIGRGLQPVTKTASGLKLVSTHKQKPNGLKGKGCKKIHGKGLKILQ